MENVTETNEAATEAAPVKSINYQKIATEFALRGLTGVQSLFNEGVASRASIQRAADELVADGGIDATELVEWVRSITPAPSGRGPGRGAIQPGETREYKVQFVNGQFLRLPTPTLEQGMIVPVTFSEDGTQMVVQLSEARPAPEPTEGEDGEVA